MDVDEGVHRPVDDVEPGGGGGYVSIEL